jgi:ABC-type branched-subunit amino acid transport system substrate-binding protein
MRTRRGHVVSMLAVALAAAPLATACTADTGGNIISTSRVHLYGSDGNMSNSFGDALKDHPGILAGMKGTTALTPLSDAFKRRMRDIDPDLTDFNYGGESYDAVVIAALAAESARSTDAVAVAKYVNGVTASGTTCETVAACMSLIHAGKDIAYRGVSLRRSGLTDIGEPSTATYGTLNFGRDNHIDDGKTEYVAAGDERTETKASSPPAPSANGKPAKAGPLKIGALLPHTGGLAFQGPPLFAGVKLGIKEVNDSGGVLGQPVEWLDGDDGTNPQVALATADRLISAGVQVIIGAAASSITAAVLPKVVAAGRLLISPSATSDALSHIDDKSLFFRTSPPDVLQAKALADILMRDGTQRIVMVGRDDAYGTGIQHNVQADLASAGIAPGNIRLLTYPAKSQYPDTDLDSVFLPIAKTIRAFRPDAVLVIGYDESALVIKAMVAAGITLQD